MDFFRTHSTVVNSTQELKRCLALCDPLSSAPNTLPALSTGTSERAMDRAMLPLPSALPAHGEFVIKPLEQAFYKCKQ